MQLLPLMAGGMAMLAALGVFGRWLLGAQLSGVLQQAVRGRLGRPA
jgi:hypothetical protein